MTAVIRNKPDFWRTPVADMPVAENRYTDDFDDEFRWNRQMCPTLRDWRKHVPYQVGDVIWCERWSNKERKNVPCKALVLDVFWDREYLERSGDRREKYRIAWATKDGKWSSLYAYVHPGYVQRGYNMAG